MELESLKKVAYQFYPKGISSIDNSEGYKNSLENRNLVSFLKSGALYSKKELGRLLIRMDNELDLDFEDVTVESWYDRCYNWQALIQQEGNKKLVLCVNISKILPTYISYLLEVEFDEALGRLKYLPRRNYDLEENDFKEIFSKLDGILTESFESTKIFKFPKDLLHVRLSDLSFQDIDFDNLTMFNAFFLNSLTTRHA